MWVLMDTQVYMRVCLQCVRIRVREPTHAQKKGLVVLIKR